MRSASRQAPPRGRNCGSPRICSAMRFPAETSITCSAAPWRSSSRICSGRSSRRRTGRAVAVDSRTNHAMCRPRCGEWWRPETVAAAHSWLPAANAAGSDGSSSSITSNRTVRAAGRPPRTSSSDAAPTTGTRRRSSMDPGESTVACSGSRRRIGGRDRRRSGVRVIRSGTDEPLDRYLSGSAIERRT